MISELYAVTAAHLLFRKDNDQLIPYEILQAHNPADGEVLSLRTSARSVNIIDYRLHP